jgi:hypothetical protein
LSELALLRSGTRFYRCLPRVPDAVQCACYTRRSRHLGEPAWQEVPGEYRGWIAPPRVGIDNKPGDFEYVKLAA